jgi:hypothetical protein
LEHLGPAWHQLPRPQKELWDSTHRLCEGVSQMLWGRIQSMPPVSWLHQGETGSDVRWCHWI